MKKFLLIKCNDDNSDCEVSIHDTYEQALGQLRDDYLKFWKEDLKIEDTEEIKQTIANKDSWTLEDMRYWSNGENNINTIHIKEIDI